MTHLDYMRRDRTWYNVELTKTTADLLKPYLKSHGIYFEPSEAGNLIHFELYANDIEVRLVNDFLERKHNG